MKKRESVFVVSARDGVEMIVLGAYRSFGDAVKACVDEIMGRMPIPAVSAMLRNDENRGPVWKAPETDAAWREHLEHELVTQHCYYAKCGEDMLWYDIDEAGVAGSPERDETAENVGDGAFVKKDEVPDGRR